ncbi:hypothetical protein B0H11DRAFT_1927204 [Mycena galericulata]|nr:hypothetical protein B0H11DRAFT_1927204 [Mycena galericulata]
MMPNSLRIATTLMALITIATGAVINAEKNVVQRHSVHMQPARAIPSVALDSMLANLGPQSRPILSRGKVGLRNDADLDAGADLDEWDTSDSYLLLEGYEEDAAAMNSLYKSTVATKKGADGLGAARCAGIKLNPIHLTNRIRLEGGRRLIWR